MARKKPTDFAAILKKIEQKAGRRLEPGEIVEKARSTRHPLHKYFDWDDTSAASKWRLEQARHLVYKVRCVVTDVGSFVPGKHLPFYVRDPVAADGDQGFVALPTVIGDEDRSRVVLKRELERLSSSLERVQAMAVALGDPEAFNRLLASFVVKGGRKPARTSRSRAASAST